MHLPLRPLLSGLLWATLTPTALAQSIIPAADGTGTLVMPDGSTYQITGGTLSGDGANLFHSFEQFGLTAAEVANFLADPSVQNILGRVTGGNASVIDGLLQVSGSSANLYLLNPAGILFGPNSAINLDGSFTATTASGIGFGENWLHAIGAIDYSALAGNPTAFAFGGEPGALINAGNLAVNAGETITLASGSLINLGTLTAPGGQITVLAVPGENLVSIRPEGALLSLELATLPEGIQPGESLPFSPLDIPSLLRAASPDVTTGIAVNDDGTVSLTGSSAVFPTNPGTALVSGTLAAVGETGGTVQVLGDRVAVIGGTIDASGTQGGGTVLVGGEYQGQGTTPTANRTYVDASSAISADALESGDGGEVILWADEGTQFDGTITARGGANAGDGGFVEVSGKDTLAFNGTVDVSAANGELGTLLLDPTNITISAAASTAEVDGDLPDILSTALPGDVTINSATLQSQTGNVILQADNNITIASGVSLTFVPGGSITFTADADKDNAGSFVMENAADTIFTNGRDISIAGAAITLGRINTNPLVIRAIDIDAGGVFPPGAPEVTIGTATFTFTVPEAITAIADLDVRFSAKHTYVGDLNISLTSPRRPGQPVRLFSQFGGTSENFQDTIFDSDAPIPVALGTAPYLGRYAPVEDLGVLDGTDPTGTWTLTVDDVLAVDVGQLFKAGEAAPWGTAVGTQLLITSEAAAGSGGNVTLNGNEVNLLGPITGGGTLQIQPNDQALAISLGGTGDPTTTFLNQAELAQLGNGFSSRIIGQADSTGTVTLQPLTLTGPLTIAGGSTLVGTAGNDAFALTGPGSGTVANLNFNSIENLNGGAGNDSFAIANDTASLSGTIDGGEGTDTVDYSATSQTISTGSLLNIEAVTGNGSSALVGTNQADRFTVSGLNAGNFKGINFSGIRSFNGLADNDTIVGTSGNDSFSVTGNNSADLQGISFSQIETLAGNGGNDTINLAAGVLLNLAVDGGGSSLTLQGENVVLNANVSTGADLQITASTGTIAQTGGTVTAGGTTTLAAPQAITLTGQNDFNQVTVTQGTNVSLNDVNDIQLNNLTFAGSLSVAASGSLTTAVDIRPSAAGTVLSADNLAADNLAADSSNGVSLTSGGNLTTANITAPGAPITLRAGRAISTGSLSSFNSGGNGGAVNVRARGDRIQLSTINTQGSLAGGAITVQTPSTFQATRSFIDQAGVAASLSSRGGTSSGPIVIGYGFSTFTVGDPSINGTQAAITTGNVFLPAAPNNPIFSSRLFGRNLPGAVTLLSFNDKLIEVEEPAPPEDATDSNNAVIENLLVSNDQSLTEDTIDQAEDVVAGEFSGYFGSSSQARSVTLSQTRASLRSIQAQTGEVPAFLYVRFNRDADGSDLLHRNALELLLITADGDLSRVTVFNATTQDVLRTQEQLRRQLTNPNLTDNTGYLQPAQQLYDWLIAPVLPQLEAAGVTNIGFILDKGLRSLPLAALHDGKEFLIETYSIGLIPSVGLIDITYVPLNRENSSLLISGASQFINQPPLLAAEVEMSALEDLWQSTTRLEETQFTVDNLQSDRGQAQIIHMATHAEFLRGAPNNSYLQFFDSRLHLDAVRRLRWFDPQVELVTLSACQTAMGNTDAELGFAGFALQAGAKSALASLWQVSDEATAGLMITFYQNLDREAIKSQALREAQRAMIRGETYTENGELFWPGGSLTLPPELMADGRQNLRHPFYWAAFTMVGSPW